MPNRILQVSPINTDDLRYSMFIASLPDNQRNTPESEYRTRRGWELNGRPINFEQALERGMYGWDNSDKSYHGNSVAYNVNDDAYEFLKPKHHETVQYELDWFNKGLKTLEGGKQRRLMGRDKREWKDFRQNYTLDDSGKYYRYIKPHFIKRLEDPNRKYIINWENPRQISTHKMAADYYHDGSGRAIVYPFVQEINGQLIDFTRPPWRKGVAYDAAIQNKDYLMFDNLQDAIHWTETYKDRYKNFKK